MGRLPRRLGFERGYGDPAADASGSATITLTLSDDGGTANGGNDTSTPQSFTITVDNINDEPSFTVGPNQTVNEDAGAQTVSPWATAIEDGDPGVTQTLTFNVTGNTNGSLFSAGPSVSPTGALIFTPAADANGTATITLTLSDDGGTANGGVDTSVSQMFTITVNAANDAPVFSAGPNQAVDEDSGAQSVSGWASGISPGPADESGQTASFTVTGNTDPSLFSAGPAVSPTGTLTYTPAPNAFGTSTITLTLSDDGGTANGGVDTSGPQSFTITVNAVNDAPSFTKGADQTVLEDAGAQAVAWATGISARPAYESGQTLAFNITGNTAPGLFLAGPVVSPSGVLTFTPAPNAFGSAIVTLVLQDNGGTANGGADTFGPQVFTITVLAVNDPPVATAKSHQAHSGVRVTIGATDTGKLKEGATDVDDPFGDLAVNAIFGSITPAGATIALMSVTFRPIGPDDQAFLLEVYASTRREELALVDWDEAKKARFLQMQFAAQHRYYQDSYTETDFLIKWVSTSPHRLLDVPPRWWEPKQPQHIDPGGAKWIRTSHHSPG